MTRDLIKTGTYLDIHLMIGFTVAYVMTGSAKIAGGIALIDPLVNAVAFFFHEKAWRKDWKASFRGFRLARRAEAGPSVALA